MRFWVLAFCLACAPARAGVRETVAALAPAATVLVVDAQGHEQKWATVLVVVTQNADIPFVPASVTKIVTAWLALDILGPDYRFTTRFYLDADRRLYVRGGGDPYLISEELAVLAKNLVATTGPAPYSGLVLDASYYPADLAIPGIEADAQAYDAPNAALGVNFNTVFATRRGDDVRSAEPQTPITPLAIAEFRAHGPNGAGRISLPPAVGLPYAGELLAAFVARAGGAVNGPITTGGVPPGLAPVYVHKQSRPLSEILVGLLKDSNNYTANQIFLEIGAAKLGGPVSLTKSLQVAEAALAAQGLAGAMVMKEGAGISRDARFTARGLAKVLDLFAPHADLLRGHNGGLDKTGTMSGVRTLAGYADTKAHGRVRFVFAGTGNDEMRFRVLKAVEAGL